MKTIFYIIALLFSVFTGIAYVASFVRLTGANGFKKPFFGSILRVLLGVIFILTLLRLPNLLAILMVLLSVGTAVITLRFLHPA